MVTTKIFPSENLCFGKKQSGNNKKLLKKMKQKEKMSPLHLINLNYASVVVPSFNLACWPPMYEFICWDLPFSKFKEISTRLANKCYCASYFN